MKLDNRDLVAVLVSGVAIIGWAWFWVLQVFDVIDLLRMAYG